MNKSLASSDTADATDDATPAAYVAQPSDVSSDAVNDGSWRRWPGLLRRAIERVAGSLRSVGPYVAIELLLPGGSIIALALWTYRHRRASRGAASPASTAVTPTSPRPALRCVSSCGRR